MKFLASYSYVPSYFRAGKHASTSSVVKKVFGVSLISIKNLGPYLSMLDKTKCEFKLNFAS